MEDIFAFVLFMLFVLAPLLGGRKKKRPPPQQRQRGQATSRAPETGAEPKPREEYTRPYRPAPPARAEESAQEMIPADLWRVLTGQEPPPVLRGPDAEAERYADEGEDELAGYLGEEASLEDASLEEEPEIISLESTTPRTPPVRPLERFVPTTTQRHDAFHDRMAALRPIRVRRVERSPLHGLLKSRDSLKRAVILREVLGPPKSLE